MQFNSPMEYHGLTAVVPKYCSAESAEAFQEPAFAKATAGPSYVFIPGLTPEVFCVGG
jgi:hypothetical protein